MNGRIQWDPTFIIDCARAIKYGVNYLNNTNLGDVNYDQGLNILDIVLIIDLILNQLTNPIADMNDDNIINILDILILTNIILGYNGF